jgi:hypothetical protein
MLTMGFLNAVLVFYGGLAIKVFLLRGESGLIHSYHDSHPPGYRRKKALPSLAAPSKVSPEPTNLYSRAICLHRSSQSR